MVRSDYSHCSFQRLLDSWGLIDIAPSKLHIAGLDFLWLAVFMRPGVGVGGCNIARYEQQASFVPTLEGFCSLSLIGTPASRISLSLDG